MCDERGVLLRATANIKAEALRCVDRAPTSMLAAAAAAEEARSSARPVQELDQSFIKVKIKLGVLGVEGRAPPEVREPRNESLFSLKFIPRVCCCFTVHRCQVAKKLIMCRFQYE